MKDWMGRLYSALARIAVRGLLVWLAGALLMAWPVARGEEAPAENGIEVLLCVTQNGQSFSGTEADGQYGFVILGRNEEETEAEAGRLTLEVKDGQTARETVSGLPAGEYIVRPEGEGAALLPEESRLSLGSEGVETAVFTLDLKNTGTLTVAASPAEGRDADVCGITVTLSDGRINGVYGEAVFSFGRASLRLSSGETAVIPGLPAGVEYTVAEEDGGALILYPEAEGPHRVSAGDRTLVTVDRPRNTLGRLEVRCEYKGSAADPDRMFAFLVQLSDPTVNGRYGDMKFAGGEAEVFLKSGERCIASGLPDGVEYGIITQELRQDVSVNSSGAAGRIQGGRESEASFVFANQVGGLEISLNCLGNDIDPARAFRVRVTLTDSRGEPLTEYDEAPFRGGRAVLAMNHGQIECLDLPEGALWAVNVEDASPEGFTAGTEGPLSGTAEGGRLKITYTRNTYGGFRIAALSSGNLQTLEDPFFVLTLNDTTISGQYGDVAFRNGESVNAAGGRELTLAKGGLLRVTGLPNGVEYTLTVRTKANEPEAWKAQNSRGVVTGTSPDSASRDADGLVTLSAWERIVPDPLPAGLTLKDGEMTLVGKVCLLDGNLEDCSMEFEALEDGVRRAAGRALPTGEVVFEGITDLTEGVHEWIVSLTEGEMEGVAADRIPRRILFRLEKDADGTMTGEVLACSDPLVFACRSTAARFCARTPSGKWTRGNGIRVIDGAGETAAYWVSDGTVHTVYGLKAGPYVWQEKNARGSFEVREDGTVLQDGVPTDCVMIPEEEQSVYIGLVKTDTEGQALKGAVLEVRDRYGNVADTWTTDERVHWISGLRSGETYTLVETRPVEGYVKWIGEMTPTGTGVETALEVREDEGALILELKTEKPAVRVLLRDGETGEAVVGAVLCVTDGDGQTAAEWTTGETPAAVTGLSTLQEYTLTEKTPGPGMKAMEGSVTFRVDEDGVLHTPAALEGKDLMVLETVRNTFAVLRMDAESGEVLSGAVLALKDADGSVLEEWVSEAGQAHLVRGLSTGREVLVTEITPPEGYRKAADQQGIQTDGDRNGGVTLSSARTRITVLRTDEAGNPIPAAGRYGIYDESGACREEWTGSEHVLRGLKAGKWTVREITPPAGYAQAAEQGFEIAPDGTAGDPVILSSMATSLKVTAADAARGTPLAGVSVQVLDGEGRTVREFETGEEGFLLTGLDVNTVYRLRQTAVPENYGPGAEVSFSLAADGSLAGAEEQTLVLPVPRQTCELMITNIIQGENSSRRFAYRLEMRLEGRRWPDNCRYTVLDGNGQVISSGLLISGVSVECGTEETIRLTGIPSGTEYRITEMNHKGYYCMVSVNGTDLGMREVAKGTLTDPDRIEMLVFTNTATR